MLPVVDHFIRARRNEDRNRQLRLQRRILRADSTPFNLPDARFIELFRLNKNLVHNLITSITPHLNNRRYRSGITNEIKIFTALRFYATGCYQRSVGENYNLGLSQTSVHRCIHEVTEAIDQVLADQIIVFPRTRAELERKRQLFMRKFNFPGVIGAIDCTHVAILKPQIKEHNFVNRKGYHSINAQIICDADLRILNINANFPGSTHDSFIWRQSQIKTFMDRLYANRERGFWLIGDSGYPLEPCLMTPFVNPGEGTPEARYNFRHAGARNSVERCIGLLKVRFRCILKERTARYAPQFVGALVNTCAVLHNMCINDNVPLLGDEFNAEGDDPLHLEENNQRQIENNVLQEGRIVRQNIVNRYFLNI